MNRDLMLVYAAVKEKLGTEYENVFFQTMREDKQGDVGIYLYESSNDVSVKISINPLLIEYSHYGS